MYLKTKSQRDGFDCSIQFVSLESQRILNCKPQEINPQCKVHPTHIDTTVFTSIRSTKAV